MFIFEHKLAVNVHDFSGIRCILTEDRKITGEVRNVYVLSSHVYEDTVCQLTLQ